MMELECSYELQVLLDHLEQDHYLPPPQSQSQQSQIRKTAEFYLRRLADGHRDEETLLFAGALAEAIVRTGATPVRQESSPVSRARQKKRPQAVLRATGLAGHPPREYDELLRYVTIAEAFGVPQKKAIQGAIDLGIISEDSDPEKELSRSVKRCRK